MKLGGLFKQVFLVTLAFLYSTGLAIWILGKFFLVDHGLGPQPQQARVGILKSHGVFGMVFFITFGYLLKVHVLPGLGKQKRKTSGFLNLLMLAILMLTVPFLFYATDERTRAFSIWLHTYFGLLFILPFIFHIKELSKRVKK